ncbi:hypothetical protein CJF32_00008553 [Rutstroemia sp. NJR-2017a WRK4]|nr:hypothetical protein CJF32_00008553 [Rutstroemia sp. NJR-2017a WRK4]
MRFRSKTRYLHSPLDLRRSIIRLRHQFSYPYLTLLKLFIQDLQWPSLHWSYDFPLPEPLDPKDITENEALFDSHHPNLYNLRYVPIWTLRDNSLRAIYRIYEVFMTREFVLLRSKWAIRSTQDPCDPHPVRYAMLASIVEELGRAFNWRLKHGQRRNRMNVERTMENPWPDFEPEVVPDWTRDVPAIREEDLRDLPEHLVQNSMLVLEDGGCENF